MKELVVISGKGGTGKTSLMGSFASLSENKIMCDADVDAADLHLLMQPKIQQRNEFSGGGTALIKKDQCTECGLCVDLCRYDAISEQFRVDPIACEGCFVCAYMCPEQAIDFPTSVCGQWFVSETRWGLMVHARLGIAEENSGKLVTLVRQKSKEIARENNLNLIITDGPPGIGCPVIASIGGATAVLIVAEPSLSSLHDMKRVASLASHFKVPAMACINKYDLNPDQTRLIEAYGINNGIKMIGRIPFDTAFTHAMVNGQTLVEYQKDSASGKSVQRIWEKIEKILN